MNLPPAARRQTDLGLGLIFALFIGGSEAGWQCANDAQGQWLCQGDSVSQAATTEAPAPTLAASPAVPASAAPKLKTTEQATAANTTAPAAVAQTKTPEKPIPETAIPKTAPTTHKENTAVNTASKPFTKTTNLRDDWVPLAKLNAKQSEPVEAQVCCGAYVDPIGDDEKQEPDSASVFAHADTTSTNLATQTTTLKGDVQMRQGYRYVRADTATLNKKTNTTELSGHVALREPNLLLLGEKADIQTEEDTMQIEKAQYLIHGAHINGDAGSLSRSDTGVISMTDGSYSYCPVGSEEWRLYGKRIKLDPNDSQGRMYNATLRVANVPVFYTPYMQFPIGKERMSGFLTPSFGHTDQNGADIDVPYYFNLAPNYDLIVAPRYIKERGNALGGQFRHLSAESSSSITTMALSNDRKASKSGLDDDSKRWYISGVQTGQGERWSSAADIAAVSDDYYFQDLGGSSFRIGNTYQIRKRAAADYLPGSLVEKHWRVGTEVKAYQTFTPYIAQPHDVWPSLFADGNYQTDDGIVLNLYNHVTEFKHRNAGSLQTAPVSYNIDGTEKAILTGSRYRMDYSAALPMRNAGAFLTPKAGVRYVQQKLDTYGRSRMGDTSDPSTSSPTASIDSGLIFERDAYWFGNNYQQTLEPRLFFYYSKPSNNQEAIYNFDSDNLSFSYAQLFRDYRFAGDDYIDDANLVSMGVSSRVLSPSTGRELFRVGVGQSVYLDSSQIFLNNTTTPSTLNKNPDRSPLVGEAAARINSEWEAYGETLWDQDNKRTDMHSVSLRYRDTEQRLFNVGYQYLYRDPTPNATGQLTQRTVEQYNISGSVPLSNQWSVLALSNHDVTNGRNLESIAGVEYDNCCWSTRFVMRRWALNRGFVDNVKDQEEETGVFLQVQLKGLGDVGQGSNGALGSIPGFENRNDPLD